MEQNFQPYLYLQVIHERKELYCKHAEDRLIVRELGSYENEKTDEVVKWINEASVFMTETIREMSDESLVMDSFWCNNMISRIRKLRAKRGPKFTFQRVTTVGSSSINMAPLSLREELYCKLRLLIKIRRDEDLATQFDLPDDDIDDGHEKGSPEEDLFIVDMKEQLEESEYREKNSDWYRNQIAQARIYIGSHDQAFFLQSPKLLWLHEELYYEVSSLISVKMADLMIVHFILKYRRDLDQFKKVLRNRIRKVNKFLTEINQQLKEKISEENSDWYHKKIEETKSFIDVLSQDLGSTISMFTPEPESKPHLDDVGYSKFWSLQVNDFEKGTSILTMEQDSKTCLFLQVVREYMELSLQSMEDCSIYEDSIEDFDEILKWTKEVDEFKGKARKEVCEISVETNSLEMISRIRELRAKRGPYFTFRIVNSSQDVIPLSSHENFLCELMPLTRLRLPLVRALQISKDDDKFNECLHGWKHEVNDFIFGMKKNFKFKFYPETAKPGWYSKKIAEARTLMSKFEPVFSLQSHVGSASSKNIPLHEELCYEIRLLIKLRFVDMMTAYDSPIIDDHDLLILFQKQLQEWINEVNKFLTEIKLQFGEENLEKSSIWYKNKIAGSRTLIAKRYSAFPLRLEDVGYIKQQYPIFLSFAGKDTRFRFTRDLYNALQQKEFNVFMDDQGLERGDSISQVLMEAIENSKLSIIIFSKNFANSTWCLDDVVKILECKKNKNQLVWPVFYKVEPSDVRYQNKNYGEAMAKHETRFGDEMVKNWRSALHEVSGFNAFPYKKDSGYESDFIQTIVKAATKIRDGS